MSGIVYSPVCDTDKSAYLAYLSAFVGNGAVAQFDGGECGGPRAGGCGGGCNDSGSCADSFCRGFRFAAGFSQGFLSAFSSGDVVNGYVCSGDSHARGAGEVAVHGVSRILASGGGSVVVGSDGDRGCESSKLSAGEVVVDLGEKCDSGVGISDSAEVDQSATSVVAGSSGRKEKNKRRRERRRVAKLGVNGEDFVSAELPEWRRRDPLDVKNEFRKERSSGFVGYFDGLSEDVKIELKESRARRLIAENKRKAAEDEQKEKVNGDPLIESLRAVMSVMRIEKQVGKLAGDSVIGGWAKTVASAASKTTASEQGSGSLSLASIGSTPPVDAGGLPLSQREVAYREALVRLHDHYDRRAAFSDDEVKADIQEIREAYADVCYTPAQAEKRRLYKIAETLALSMGSQPARQEGMLQLIEKTFEDEGEEDERILLDSNFSKLLGRTYL